MRSSFYRHIVRVLRTLLLVLVFGTLCPGEALGACCAPEVNECDLPTGHRDAHCNKGEVIVDGDVSNLFECWTAGLIFIDPTNPFTYLIALGAGELVCDDHFDEGVCAAKDRSGVVETANGIDDNCDGVGLGDEFCDGIDNDGDGAVDEDAGSCKVRILAVPYCWSGTDASFKAAVDLQWSTFLSGAGIDGCAQNYHLEVKLPSVLNAPCPSSFGFARVSEVEKHLEDTVGIDLADFDAFGAFTDQDFGSEGFLLARGATSRDGRFWAEATTVGASKPDVVMAHEFGHVLNLDEEYCSVVAGGLLPSPACNKSSSINFLGADHGCNPSDGSCCVPDAGDITCAGNHAVVAPSVFDISADSPTGRCIMSHSSAAEPRTYCHRCMQQVSNVAGIKCGSVHPGSERILKLKGISDPGQKPIFAYSFITGRGGLQNLSPRTGGDVKLSVRHPVTGLPFAERWVDYAQVFSGDELAYDESFSLRIPLPADVSNTSRIPVVAVANGVEIGRTTINGAPPVVSAGPDRSVECTGRTTTVVLNGSATDPDGDTLTYEWKPNGGSGATATVSLPVGTHDYELRASDGVLTGADGVRAVVFDHTAPTISLGAMGTFVKCSDETLKLVRPSVYDLCSDVILTGRVIQSSNPGLSLPFDVNSGDVRLPVGTHVVEWSARDSSGNVSVKTQIVEVVSALHSNLGLDLRDRSVVRVRGSTSQFATLTSKMGLELGVSASAGTTLVGTNAFLRSNARIFGDLRVGGTISLQSGALVTGSSFSNSLVGLPSSYGSVAHLSVGNSNSGVMVEPGQTKPAAPGTYGTLSVKSRGKLVLEPGVYRVRDFFVEPSAEVVVPDGTVLIVKENLFVRGQVSAGFVIAYLGANQVMLESSLIGTLVAPSATVDVARAFTGLLVAGLLRLEPDIVLECDATAKRPVLVFP